MEDTKFETRGAVLNVTPLQGSFCLTTIVSDGKPHTYCLGFGQRCGVPGQWPAKGETIVVTGVIRNGKHLTEDWKLA